MKKLRQRRQDMSTISQLLTAAEKLASAEGIPRPGAEHLVQAALDHPDGTARGALSRLGLDGGDFASTVAGQHADALATVGVEPPDGLTREDATDVPDPAGLYLSDASAQQLFQEVAREARRESGPLTGAHVIRAAARLRRGTTARALARMGLDAGALEDAAQAEIDQAGSRRRRDR